MSFILIIIGSNRPFVAFDGVGHDSAMYSDTGARNSATASFGYIPGYAFGNITSSLIHPIACGASVSALSGYTIAWITRANSSPTPSRVSRGLVTVIPCSIISPAGTSSYLVYNYSSIIAGHPSLIISTVAAIFIA